MVVPGRTPRAARGEHRGDAGGFTIRWRLPLLGPPRLRWLVAFISLGYAATALVRRLSPEAPQASTGFLVGSTALFVASAGLALGLWRLRRYGALVVTPAHVIAAGAGAAWRGKVLVSSLNAVIRGERIAGRGHRRDAGNVSRFFERYTTPGASAEADLVLIPMLTAVNKRLESTVLFRTLPSANLAHWLEEVMYAWLENRGGDAQSNSAVAGLRSGR